MAGAAGWLLKACAGLSGIMVTETLFLIEGRFLKNYSPPFLLSELECVELKVTTEEFLEERCKVASGSFSNIKVGL